MKVFDAIIRIDLPEAVEADGETRKNPAFEIEIVANGEIPFPQVILHAQDGQHIIGPDGIERAQGEAGEASYLVHVPAGLVSAGEVRVQVEGCRKADWRSASGGDWVKAFGSVQVKAAPRRAAATAAGAVTLYFGIHKHMHQPYYNTTDANYWDGEKDGIFGS
ncbi:MAG: hypothetical protein ACXWVH_09315, partial [Caulobacteraceae bacterium]